MFSPRPRQHVWHHGDVVQPAVVGAWTWIPELDIGLTTEVDVAEAFRPLKTLMTMKRETDSSQSYASKTTQPT